MSEFLLSHCSHCGRRYFKQFSLASNGFCCKACEVCREDNKTCKLHQDEAYKDVRLNK